MTGYVPPQDLDAEAAVLSTCLLMPEAYDEVTTVLDAAHFYADANRRVWEAVEALTRRSSRVDVLTVAEHLRTSGRLEQVGGTPYLAQLVNATPATTHVLEHARIVRDCWRKRSAIEVLTRRLAHLRGSANERVPNEELDRWLSDASAELEAVSHGKGGTETVFHVADLTQELANAVAERSKKGTKMAGMSTGLRDLDAKIGGLKRGMKYEVAARPGIGKTGFLCSVALNMASAGQGVVLISIEMPREQLVERLVAQRGSLDTRKLESGDLSRDEWGRYTKASTQVSQLPIVVDESGSHTAQSIRSAVRRGVKKLRDRSPDVKLGLIGIDYVQLVHASGKKKGQSREQELAEVSSATREMAKEFDCAVVELSQLSREVEKRPDKRPQLSDMKDSGSLEADAFGVLMLYREDYYRKPGEPKDGCAEVLVRKLRGGETCTVPVLFHAPSAGFFDEPDPYAMPPLDDDWRDGT